jgi:energy-coupling factor transporter ATP-binding protein EcfA2
MVRALTVDRLSVHYAGARSPALHRASFGLDAGSSLAVLGSAGAGKTTLLQSLAGLLHAQPHAHVEGTIQIGQRQAHSVTTTTAFPAVSMLPQDPRNIVTGFVPTVYDEILITLRQALIPVDAWDEHVSTLLGQVPITPLLPRDPRTLSGGEMQAVALGIAAVARPVLLLLDEPATALDQERVDDLLRFVLRRDSRMAVIVADTTLHAAILGCERVIILDRGNTVFFGTREEFWQRLPEFQDHVTLGGWIDLWHRRSVLSAGDFRAILETVC